MDLRDVIGQRRLLARLGERAVRGDVAHGYELSGPRSIGKHTLALRLAQTLNCATEPVVPGGCGVCIACRKIERGLHPDVREITARSSHGSAKARRVSPHPPPASPASPSPSRWTRERASHARDSKPSSTDSSVAS